MKKALLLVSFYLLIINICKSQPSGYYSGTENLEGSDLKNALYNIIKGHTTFRYSSSETDTWDILKESDKDPANEDNVIMIYTQKSVNAAQEYNNGNGWTREHVWAKSRGDFGTDEGTGTDVHNLKPCLNDVNSDRGNRWFAESNVEYYYDGDFTGCYYGGDTEWTWEPADNQKGDIARIIFYMAVRYEGEYGEPDLEVIDYLPDDSYTKQPYHARLSDLIAWHKADPVDDFERNRNNVIYNYQKNRNPFIDHPEFVELVWNGTDYITTDLLKILSDEFKIYPNPAKDYIFIELTKDLYKNNSKIELFNESGIKLDSFSLTSNKKHININHLSQGIYFLKIHQNKKTISRKIIVQ